MPRQLLFAVLVVSAVFVQYADGALWPPSRWKLPKLHLPVPRIHVSTSHKVNVDVEGLQRMIEVLKNTNELHGELGRTAIETVKEISEQAMTESFAWRSVAKDYVAAVNTAIQQSQQWRATLNAQSQHWREESEHWRKTTDDALEALQDTRLGRQKHGSVQGLLHSLFPIAVVTLGLSVVLRISASQHLDSRLSDFIDLFIVVSFIEIIAHGFLSIQDTRFRASIAVALLVALAYPYIELNEVSKPQSIRPVIFPPLRFMQVSCSQSGLGTQCSDIAEGKPWNAGAHPPQWIEIDLGESRLVRRVFLDLAQNPAGFTEHIVYGDIVPNPQKQLKSLAGETSNGHHFNVSLEKPEWIRYLRISTIVSPSWVGWRSIIID